MEAFAVSIIESLGYAGIFFVLFAAMIIVFIPSEVVVSFAGFAAANGDLTIGGVIMASTTGVVAGMAAVYALARSIKTARLRQAVDRYGQWIGAQPAHLQKAHKKLRKYDTKVAFIGQLLPAIRFGVGVVAGIERLPFWRYIAYTAVAACLWVSGFALLGYWLEDSYTEILDIYESILEIVSLIILIGVVGTIIYRRRSR